MSEAVGNGCKLSGLDDQVIGKGGEKHRVLFLLDDLLAQDVAHGGVRMILGDVVFDLLLITGHGRFDIRLIHIGDVSLLLVNRGRGLNVVNKGFRIKGHGGSNVDSIGEPKRGQVSPFPLSDARWVFTL